MGWRVKQICTVASELCPIWDGRSKHDEMNPEKYFLGFPISTHVSSLGYKKAEEANLQQSCVLTCSTVAMSTHRMIMLSVIVLHFSSLTLACKPTSEKTPTEGKSYTIYTCQLLKTEIKQIFCIWKYFNTFLYFQRTVFCWSQEEDGQHPRRCFQAAPPPHRCLQQEPVTKLSRHLIRRRSLLLVAEGLEENGLPPA